MSTPRPGRLEGKAAIVTGGGRGIGAAICRRYAEEGARVLVADIDAATAEATAGAITAAGGRAVAATVDVGDAGQVEAMVDTALTAFGTIDVLVNNAAIIRAAVRHVLEADEAWWDSIIETNLKGHFLCSLQVARHMAPRGGGVILMMSSGGGSRAHRGMAAYDASKGGIEALTRALALDLGPYGIRVAGLVPGMIVAARETTDPDALARTDATVPLGRAGTPEDVAGPAVFLASDDAAYVTGSMVVVDGGVLAQQRSPQAETFGLDRFPSLDDLRGV